MSDRKRLAMAAELVGCPYRDQNDHVWARNAARAYRDLLANGQRVEPDYEAALRTFTNRYEGGGVSAKELVRQTVDAAIGDKLLIDPTTTEEKG